MSRTRWTAVGLVAIASVLQPAAGRAEDAPPPDPVRQEIVAKLDSLRFTCDFSETPVRDVVDFLREYSGINFTYSKAALAVVKENPEPTVSLSVKDIQFRDALRLILDQYDLTAIYKDGVLVISTREEVERITVTVSYDIRDLLMSIRDFAGPNIELNAATDGPQTEFGPPPAEPPQPFSDPDAIMELIQKTVSPEAWSSEKATMAYLNGNLVVSASRAVHAELKKLLGMLREMR